jgi:transaldolase
MSIGRNPLRELQKLGQSVWLDDLHREMLQTAALTRLINEDGVSGITSTPSILQRALIEDPRYRSAIQLQSANSSATVAERDVYERLILEDARMAADAFRHVYHRSAGREGFVCLEVSPLLASDTAGTVAEATRLWRALDRANAMISVPATRAGLPAIAQLISAGINVNATLLFGVGRYREVLDAFATGLEERQSAGHAVTGIASVASLFVSRIDTLVDHELALLTKPEASQRARALLGKAGREVARFVYQDFKKFVASPRWRALAAYGALAQRPLWASTGTENAAYSDFKYVDELIGQDTITTLPIATLAAYRDHGNPVPSLETPNLYEVATMPADLLALGVELDAVSRALETEGVARFTASYNTSFAAISAYRVTP